jgi:hypothetical protein
MVDMVVPAMVLVDMVLVPVAVPIQITGIAMCFDMGSCGIPTTEPK